LTIPVPSDAPASIEDGGFDYDLDDKSSLSDFDSPLMESRQPVQTVLSRVDHLHEIDKRSAEKYGNVNKTNTNEPKATTETKKFSVGFDDPGSLEEFDGSTTGGFDYDLEHESTSSEDRQSAVVLASGRARPPPFQI
jgi:hypothetical protein